MRRHLLSLRELDRSEVLRLLDAAQHFAGGGGWVLPGLRGFTVATLFYEPSTRTQLSFELAARRMGAEVARCDVDRSSVRKGESLIDTARTLEALGADVLVIRHPSAGAPQLVARHVGCGVVNAGDGMHEHPTQGLLDLLTVRQVKGRIEGLRVAIIGDIVHSRVARSAAWGFTRLGAAVVLAGPATLMPPAPPVPGVELTTSLNEALRDADVVMALRMQTERQGGAGVISTPAEYTRLYGISDAVLARARPDVIVMHPGPANIGIEISAATAYGPRSVIGRQVENGVAVRMAALAWVLDVPRQAGDRVEREVAAARPRERTVAEVPAEIH